MEMEGVNSRSGFSLVEVMVAVMVMTIGLTSVAAMQTTALRGVFFADSRAAGSSLALSWSEWIKRLMSNPAQDKISYFSTGKLYRENFVNLAMLDSNPNDRNFTEVVLPPELKDFVDQLNGEKAFTTARGESFLIAFKKEGLKPFTVQDLPMRAPPGSRMVWRIAANVPVVHTATIEILLHYTTAFVTSRGPVLSVVVSSDL